MSLHSMRDRSEDVRFAVETAVERLRERPWKVNSEVEWWREKVEDYEVRSSVCGCIKGEGGWCVGAEVCS